MYRTYAPESGSALLVAKDAQGRHLGCLGVKIKAPRGDEAKVRNSIGVGFQLLLSTHACVCYE
jgi:hypothetical protein